MKQHIQAIKKQRKYTEEFKKDIVSIFEKGTYSVLQLGKLYGIKKQVIYGWIYRYSAFNEPGYRIMDKNESPSEKLKQLEEKVKELELAVGRKQMKIDFLEKLIELAKHDLGIDVKKNCGTQHSGGSAKTKKK